MLKVKAGCLPVHEASIPDLASNTALLAHNDTPTVSVIVPVYNGGVAFRTCLSSISQARPAPIELIVVADGDTDGSRDLAGTYGAHVIELPVPDGPARARNLGARAACGDILFFIDADVTIAQEAIGYVATAFKSDPELAGLIGSYDDAPPADNFLSQYKNLLHHYVHQMGREEASTFWGACGAIRRDVFLQMGGFDERYRTPCVEDIELGMRLVQRGFKLRLLKELQVTHLKRWGVISLLKTDFFRRALPWTELILRDRRMANDLNLQRSSRVSVACVYALACAIAAGFKWRTAWAVGGGLMVLLVLLNASLYRFFRDKRGWWFAVKAVPWHWLYFLYSGLAFALGSLRFLVSNREAGWPTGYWDKEDFMTDSRGDVKHASTQARADWLRPHRSNGAPQHSDPTAGS